MDTDVAPVTFQVSVVDSPLLIVEAAALNELITGSGDVVPAGVVSLPDDIVKKVHQELIDGKQDNYERNHYNDRG